jgi:hypothetical protein
VNYKRLTTIILTTLILSVFAISTNAAFAQEQTEAYRQITIPHQDEARIERFYRHDGEIDQGLLEMELGNENVMRARSYSRQAKVDLIDVMLLYYLMRNWGRVETYIGWAPGYAPAPVYYTWPVYYIPRPIIYYYPSRWYRYRPYRHRPRPCYYNPNPYHYHTKPYYRPHPVRPRPGVHPTRPARPRPGTRPDRPPRTRPQARPNNSHRPHRPKR